VKEELKKNQLQKVVEQQAEELLSIEDIRKMFNVSKVTIYVWKESGLLPYYEMNRRVYFKKAEVIDSLIKKKIRSRLLDDHML